MKLGRVWLVRDPSKNMRSIDECYWEQEVAHLDRYILGSPMNAWSEENHAMFSTRDEAETEARARFARMAERFAQIAGSK